MRLLALAGVAAFLITPVFAQEASSVRMENEIILEAPESQSTEVWDWLIDHFPPQCAVAGERLQCTRGEEDFRDLYFDTSDLSLMENLTGIRHRTRMYEDGKTTELIQVKITPSNPETTREERKFEVRGNRKVNDDDDRHPLLQFIRQTDRAGFKELLESEGIDLPHLRPAITIHQVRHRIYFGDPDPLFTISFDEISAERWWVRERIHELDIEINEIRYTASNPAERLRLEYLQKSLLEEVLEAFPDMRQDQTQKYTKMFGRVLSHLPFGRTLFRWGIL